MGLKATIAAAVTAAFSAAGDLVTEETLTAPGVLDPVTEVETPGATGTIDVIQSTQADAEKFLAGMNWRGVAGATQASDVQLIANLSSATLTPVQGMTITWRGDTYNLHSVDDVQEALALFGLRRPV
jgi:hypothetical protein